MNKQNGFTLNELFITTALISIVAVIGVPSMSNFVNDDRLTTQINSLVGHLALARSQAITLQEPVTVCASSNQQSCSSTDWTSGWVVFVDADASGDFSLGDELLRVREPLEGSSQLSSSLGRARYGRMELAARRSAVFIYSLRKPLRWQDAGR